MIKKMYDIISNIGVKDGQPEYLQAKIRLSNQASLMLISSNLCSASIALQSTSMLALTLSLVSTYVCVFILNFWGFVKFSRVWLSISASVLVTAALVLLTDDSLPLPSNSMLNFMALSLLPWLMMDIRERTLMFLATFLIIVLGASAPYIRFWVEIPFKEPFLQGQVFNDFIVVISLGVFLSQLFLLQNSQHELLNKQIAAVEESQKLNLALEESSSNLREAFEQVRRSEDKLRQNVEELQVTQEQLTISLTQNQIQNQTLESNLVIVTQQHETIISSINYALRIQNAILLKESELQKYLDCFVFFKPKDIVSGDFYWFAEKEDRKILAVMDCTGHGVSGAFMTMIGNNILNQVVWDQNISEPNEILNHISPLLEKTLSHADGNLKDGMDISIISIEAHGDGLTINYAGAMNPIYYVQDNELFEIKADKRPIDANFDANFCYNKHELNIHHPTSLYLFTDGFQDQFGGLHDKKFMVRHFKQLLLDISSQPAAEQKQKMETIFDTWKGERKQTDDVLVVGLLL